MKFITNILNIIILSFFIPSCADKTNSLDSKYYLLKAELESEKLKKNLLQDAIISIIKIKNRSISPELKIINIHGDTITLDDFVSDTYALILFTGSKFCSSCFQNELSMLSRFAIKNANFKIMVLAQNMDPRELFIEKKRNNYKFDVGVLSFNSFSDKYLSGNDFPIYFMVNEKLEITHPYIPYKQMHELTKKYLQTVSQISGY